MAYPITFNDTYPAGYLGIDDGAAKSSFSIDDSSTYAVTVVGTITAPGDTVTLTYGADAPTGYAGTRITLTASTYSSTGMIEFTSTAIPPGETTAQTYRYVLSNTQLYGNPPPAGQTRSRFTATANGDGTYSGGNYNEAAAPCYVSGTLIRTTKGDVAVEHLRVGDVVVTASGQERSIRWLGRRSYVGRFANRNKDLLPVCFTAGSLADNVPTRDLSVSPKHAMFINGMLVPAECLVNGGSVYKVSRVERLEYHHVELESHDVLIAEGAASESFVDDNGRQIFHNAYEHAALYPDAVHLDAVYCAPRLEQGEALEAIRRVIGERATRAAAQRIAG